MRDVTDDEAAAALTIHLAAVRAALSALPQNTKDRICTLPVRRSGPALWDLWAPGTCACGPASHLALALDAAATQLHTWRPTTSPRYPATTGEAA